MVVKALFFSHPFVVATAITGKLARVVLFLLIFPHFPPSSFSPPPPSCSLSHFLSLTSTCRGRQELSRLFVSVHTLHGMSTSGDSPVSSWPQSIFLHLPFKPLTTSKQNTSNSLAPLPPSPSVPLHPPCVWG